MLENNRNDNQLNLDRVWIEQQKKRDLLRQIRDYERSLSRTELIGDYIKEAVENLPPLPYSDIEIDINQEEEMVLILSDIHWGKKIYPEEVNYINSYDTEIAFERIQKLKNYIIEIGKLHNISKIHIFGLGDLLENDKIFKMQKAIVEQPVIEQLITFADILSGFINDLSNYFYIDFEISPGNHGRMTRHRDEDYKINNFEYMLLFYIQQRLIYNNRVNINLSFNYFIDKDILGFNFLGLHGEYERNLQNSLNEYITMNKKFYDYLLVGHLHHSLNIDGNRNMEVIQNGSLSGADNYSVEKMKKGNYPSQTCFTVKKDYGKFAFYKILLK